MRAWLALLLGVVTLWLGAWIYLPPPTYFLLIFAVGAPEVSHWTILVAIVGIVLGAMMLGVPNRRTAMIARVAIALNAAGLALAAGVWLRVPSTLARFASAANAHVATPASPRRSAPIVFADLFRGIPRGEARVTHDVEVSNVTGMVATQRLTAEVYAPVRRGSFPVVVQIYGGAWQRGSPSDFSNFATWLASSGYVVVAIDYRHAPAYVWPTQINDVNEALRWVVAHARKYDGDSSRIALIGRSAGAHLATYAGWITSQIPVRGVISLYGPVDLVTSYEHPPRPDPLGVRAIEEALLGGPLTMFPQQYADASTITHVGTVPVRAPPSLLIYGGRDNIVEPQYGRRIATALAATGAEVTYLELPWGEHAFDAVFNGPSSQIALYYIERFLAKAMSP